MFIEFLKFRVEPLLRDQFVQQDAAIWTTALSQTPGFGHKEVWLNPTEPSEVVTVIWWRDRDQWKAIPEAELKAIEQRFNHAMGQDTYQLIEAQEYRLSPDP